MFKTLPVENVVFPIGVLATILVYLAFPIGSLAQVLILVPAVALLGVPHGALDLAVGRQIWALRGVRDHALFVAVYVALAVATLGVWLAFPGAALALFLAYSAYHFSGDWDDWPTEWRLAGGAATIGAPALFHHAEVEEIFAQLADPGSAASLALALSGLGGMAVLLTVAAAVATAAPRHILEHALLWSAAAVLPPLLYFVAYFCFLHAPRHLRISLDNLAERRLALWSSAVLAAITLLAAAWAFVAMPADVSVSQALLTVVFVGLASLTVPHMLLVDLWHARSADMEGARSRRRPSTRAHRVWQ